MHRCCRRSTDHPALLATFPLGPFLCLHLLLGTLYLHTFVPLTPYPPLNATENPISSSLLLPSSHHVRAPQIRSHDFGGYINLSVCMYVCLQSFDTVGWAAGRASGWKKTERWGAGSWCHYHSLSLASAKSRLVLPFWYRFIWVVLDKGTGVCVCMYVAGSTCCSWEWRDWMTISAEPRHCFKSSNCQQT